MLRLLWLSVRFHLGWEKRKLGRRGGKLTSQKSRVLSATKRSLMQENLFSTRFCLVFPGNIHKTKAQRPWEMRAFGKVIVKITTRRCDHQTSQMVQQTVVQPLPSCHKDIANTFLIIVFNIYNPIDASPVWNLSQRLWGSLQSSTKGNSSCPHQGPR